MIRWFKRWLSERSPTSNNVVQKFIPEIWADDTIATQGFLKALMILVQPDYPHVWKWGRHWWHRRCCYPCAEARVKWPWAKRKLRYALKPMERDLPELSKKEAKAWVEEEVRWSGTAMMFNSLLFNKTTPLNPDIEVDRARAAGLRTARYVSTLPRGFDDEAD